MLHEFRYALRAIRQRPLFAIIAAASLAIGIGANTAIFAAIDTFLLRPPVGIDEPERVVEVGRTMRGGGFDTFSFPELLDMQRDVPQLDRVAGWRLAQMSLSAGGGGERVTAFAVSQPYFEAMGARPFRGRFFLPAEDASPGGASVAVLSHAFWRDRLGGDPGVVGRTLNLNRREFVVVGIASPSFRSHMPAVSPSIYIPLTMWGAAQPGFEDYDARWASWLMAVGRLAPGSSLEEANAGLATLFQRLAAEEPALYDRDNQRSARVLRLAPVVGGVRAPALAFMSLLLGMVLLILLTTCANVAGMLLARAAAREREIAVRLALGSTRARLVRQLLVEAVVLFAIGGAAGVALGYWATSLLTALPLPLPIPVHLELAVDARVLAAGLGLALLTGVLFGLVPALQSTRPDLLAALKQDAKARGTRASRSRRAFVMAEVSLSLLLLISAGLFLRSLQRASQVDAGFDPRGVRMLSFDLAIDGYDGERGRAFVRTLLERLEATPGVQAAATATDLPLDLGIRETGLYPEGWQGDERFGFSTGFAQVSPGYFDAAGVRVLRGRSFTHADGAAAPGVAVVSRTFAAQLWPGEDPIGRRVRWSSDDTTWITIVGVAADVKNKTLMERAEPMLYVPIAQHYDPAMTLLVRTSLGGAAAGSMIRRVIGELDGRLSLTPVQSLEEYTGIGLLPQRAAALLTTLLGLIAVLLAALGVYGVIAFAVTQRTREIGVRMALGAHRADILREVLGSTLRLAVPGLAAGAAGALALGWLMRSFILGVAPADPVVFTVMPLLLLAVILAAGWVPAARAARTDPLRALRAE